MIFIADGQPNFFSIDLKKGDHENEFVTERDYPQEEKFQDFLIRMPPKEIAESITKFVFVSEKKQKKIIEKFKIRFKDKSWDFLCYESPKLKNLNKKITKDTICFFTSSLNDSIYKIIKEHAAEVRGFYKKQTEPTVHEIEDLELILKVYKFISESNYSLNEKFYFAKIYPSPLIFIQNPFDSLVNNFTRDVTDKKNLTLLFNSDYDFVEPLINSIGDIRGEQPSKIFLDSKEDGLKSLKKLSKSKFLAIYNVETQSAHSLNNLIKYASKYRTLKTLSNALRRSHKKIQIQVFISNTSEISPQLKSLFNKFIIIPTFKSLVEKEGITKIFYASLDHYLRHKYPNQKIELWGSKELIDNDGLAELLSGIGSFSELFRILDEYFGKKAEVKFERSIDFWYEIAYLRQTILNEKKIRMDIEQKHILKISDSSTASKLEHNESTNLLKKNETEEISEQAMTGEKIIENNKTKPTGDIKVEDSIKGDSSLKFIFYYSEGYAKITFNGKDVKIKNPTLDGWYYYYQIMKNDKTFTPTSLYKLKSPDKPYDYFRGTPTFDEETRTQLEEELDQIDMMMKNGTADMDESISRKSEIEEYLRKGTNIKGKTRILKQANPYKTIKKAMNNALTQLLDTNEIEFFEYLSKTIRYVKGKFGHMNNPEIRWKFK